MAVRGDIDNHMCNPLYICLKSFNNFKQIEFTLGFLLLTLRNKRIFSNFHTCKQKKLIQNGTFYINNYNGNCTIRNL